MKKMTIKIWSGINNSRAETYYIPLTDDPDLSGSLGFSSDTPAHIYEPVHLLESAVPLEKDFQGEWYEVSIPTLEWKKVLKKYYQSDGVSFDWFDDVPD